MDFIERALIRSSPVYTDGRIYLLASYPITVNAKRLGRGHTFVRENKTWQIETYQCESYLRDFFNLRLFLGSPSPLVLMG